MKMKFIRQIATPLTIGAFLLMAVTGVLIFFHKDMGLNKTAHEWLSWLFLIGVGLHIFINFKPLQIYLKKPLALGIIGLFAAILTASFFVGGGEEKGGKPPVREMMMAFESAKIEQIAPLVGKTSEQLLGELNAQGYSATSAQQTLQSIAGGKEKSAAVLRTIFASKGDKGKGREERD